MAPHFSLLSPSSFFFILLLNVETVTDRILIYLACTHHFNHLVGVIAGGPEFPPRAHAAKFYVRLQLIRSALRASKFSVLKFIEIVIFVDLLHGIHFDFGFFWYFCDISFQLFKLLCLAKNLC